MSYILLAFLLDLLFGDPKFLPHPVQAIGKLIEFFEKKLYKTEKSAGLVETLAVLAVTVLFVVVLLFAAKKISVWLWITLSLYLLYAALSYRSLYDAAMKVGLNLYDGNINEARKNVGMIVGRDTENLTEKEIIRADVETVAEGYIDGIASPLFWMLVGYFFGGVAGAAAFAWLYKAANTMDSMIGYDDERYREFGFCAAKLDDAMNFLPARLGSLAAILAGLTGGFDWKNALRIFKRDRLNHKSPNSAHAESVWAGLLGIRLGGGAYYGGKFEERPYLGDDTRDARLEDILSSCKILTIATILCVLITATGAFLLR